uniref:Putative choline/ethanolamine kinase n=1 Tax=Trypanosoma congolense (strain IL3000) TaxID=1068625 RepID=G0UMJ5_TRYCI|nr:putative choline/ethanolamine kinase [Trypanosoma congolense IL3000]
MHPAVPSERSFPLGETPLYLAIRRSKSEPMWAQLSEFVRETRDNTVPSSNASWVSVGSLDSIMSLTNRTPEEMELDSLIYRLCRSLYRVAMKKSAHIHSKQQAPHSTCTDECEGQFSNMRGHQDWCPLLHLFDPMSYYNVMGTSSLHDGCKFCGESYTQNNPEDASQLLLEELSVTRLEGGNSNHVYRLGHSSFPEKSILLRVYGDAGGSEVIDRVRDRKVMKLMSDAEMGPGILHSFHWGRVEEFMDGVQTCTTEKLLTTPSLLADVYGGLCKMHKLNYKPLLPESLRGAESKGGRDQQNNANGAASLTREAGGCCSGVESVMALENVCDTSFERVCIRLLRLVCNNVVEEHRQSIVHWFAGEIISVRGELQRREIPVVLSHNDLNPGNILLPGDTDSTESSHGTDEQFKVESTPLSKRYVTQKGKSINLVERRGFLFIDFEYADANYRCFDLGNTLCELDYDYTRETEAGGRGFIKYLFLFPPKAKEEAWRGFGEEYPRMPELIYDSWREGSCDGTSGVGSVALLAVRRYFAERDGVPLEAVELSEEQVGEVLLGMLASHIYWTLWAITMGCAPDDCGDAEERDPNMFAFGGSGLDYMRYGECRLREYIALREWLVDRGFFHQS